MSRHSQQSYHYIHSRDTIDETLSNEINFDIKLKKRTHHYTDNSNYSPKRHRRTSPSLSYSASTYSSHHYRRSKYRLRSSSSSTHSSEKSSSNENHNNNQRQRSTKGTLASELDKLRPKINKNKTEVPSDQLLKSDNNVRIIIP